MPRSFFAGAKRTVFRKIFAGWVRPNYPSADKGRRCCPRSVMVRILLMLHRAILPVWPGEGGSALRQQLYVKLLTRHSLSHVVPDEVERGQTPLERPYQRYNQPDFGEYFERYSTLRGFG